MPLTQSPITLGNFITAYLASQGITSSDRSTALRGMITDMWSAIWKSHAFSWDWAFMEECEKQVSVDDSVISVDDDTDIAVVKSMRVTSSVYTRTYPFLPVRKELWDAIYETHTADDNSKYPRYIAHCEGKFFFIPKAESGTTLAVSGIVDPDTDTGNVYETLVPGSHTEALIRLVDFKLQKAPLQLYLEEVKKLGGSELRDIWGVKYGSF